MQLPPALAARLDAREAARREAAASLRQQRSNAGDAEEDFSADLAKWREAVSALEREAREAAGALTSSSSKPIVVVDDEETSASTPSASSSSSSFNLDSLSARLSELEQQAAVLATKIGRSREGETLLSRAASAREALRAARASAAPVFSLAAAAAAVAVAGAMPEAAEEERAAAEEAEEKQQQKKKKQQDQQDAEEKASRVADAARDAARLGGLRGETLRLGGASFGRCSSPSPSSSPSSRSLPSLRLDNLADCTVVVEVPLGALVATGLTRCVVFLACPVGGGGGGRGGGGRGGGGVSEEEKTKTPGGGGGAVLIDGASASTFYLAAHQCRLHRLVDNCKVYVRSAAPPVIEACSTLKLAPYPVSTSTSTSTSTSSPSSSPSSSSSSPSSSSSSPSSSSPSSSSDNNNLLVLPASEASLRASGLGSEEASRSWSRPRDFSWPLAAAGKPSPHWKKMAIAEREAPPTGEGFEAAPVEALFPPVSA